MATEEKYVIHLDYSEKSHVLTGRPPEEMREELKSQKVATYHPRLYVDGTTPTKGWLIKKDQLEKAKEIIERLSKQKVKVQNLIPYSEVSVVKIASDDGVTTGVTCLFDRQNSKVGLRIEEDKEKVCLVWSGWKSFKTFKEWMVINLSTAPVSKLREFLARIEWYEMYSWYPDSSAKKIKFASIQLLKDFMLTYRDSSKISKENLEVLLEPMEKVFHNAIESQKNHVEVFCEKNDGRTSWFSKSKGEYIGLFIQQNEDGTLELEWRMLDVKGEGFGLGPMKFLQYQLEKFFVDIEKDLLSPSKVLPGFKTLETLLATIEIIERFNSEGDLKNLHEVTKDFLSQPRKIFEASLKYFGA